MSNERRDKKIYSEYLCGSLETELSSKYNLKVSTINKIIRRYRKSSDELYEFIDAMYYYVAMTKTMGVATRIKNSLMRMCKNRHIFTIDELMEYALDENGFHRGIGEKSRICIKEFHKVYKRRNINDTKRKSSNTGSCVGN